LFRLAYFCEASLNEQSKSTTSLKTAVLEVQIILHTFAPRTETIKVHMIAYTYVDTYRLYFPSIL